MAFKLISYIQLATKLFSMEDEIDDAKAFIKSAIETIDDVDGIKDKIITALSEMGAVESEFSALLIDALETVKIVSDVDLEEEELQVYIDKIYTYGTYLYQVLNGDISTVDAMTYITEALSDYSSDETENETENSDEVETESSDESEDTE